ncbi:MAG: hypothetical protein AAF480_11095 [Actinomycetota bacterium]
MSSQASANPANQRWTKLGRVPIEADASRWLDDYAAVPFLDHIEGDRYWLYFSARDQQNRSHTRRAVIDLRDPLRPLTPEAGSVVGPSRPGFFDADGAMGSDLVHIDGRAHLFYIGWNLGADVPFRNAIGIAVEGSDGTFERLGAGPVLDRSTMDPCFVASNCVLPDGDGYRMWYLSCFDWTEDAAGWSHRYHIKEARSDDGRSWTPCDRVAIDFAHPGEYAISVPRVHRRGDGLEMWYSFRAGPRGATYRVGYATAPDGISWTRRDELVDLDVSATGWDSDMVCYPYVLRHDGRTFMLYNGNGYGRTGVGLAELAQG